MGWFLVALNCFNCVGFGPTNFALRIGTPKQLHRMTFKTTFRSVHYRMFHNTTSFHIKLIDVNEMS